MKLLSLPTTFGILALLLISTVVVVLYAQGYRFDLTKGTVGRTGIILAQSIPEGAVVYLDGKLLTATNSPISNLKPGTYRLKIEKEGYVSWEKDVPVEEGMVANITALLPPLSPSLTAVTQNGARLVTRAPSGLKTLFISGEDLPAGKAGLYLFNLTNPLLGFLRTSPQKIIEETETLLLSKATKLVWSPNEDQVLVTIGKNSYLVTVSGRNGRPTLVQNTPKLLESWRDAVKEQKTALIKGLKLSGELTLEAVKPTTSWSPDERKFLYEKTADGLPSEASAKEGKRQLWVVDLSDPLPIGDKEHQMIWETESRGLKLFWLADSHHFVMIEEGLPSEASAKEGTVSLLDLDGSNKRDLFSGTLAEPIALSTADLSKIIIVTSFTPKANPNLYAIGLR